MSEGLWIALALVAVLVVVVVIVGLTRYRRRRVSLSQPDPDAAIDKSGGYKASSGITFTKAEVDAPRTVTPEPIPLDTGGLPAVGDDATVPRDTPRRSISDVTLPEPDVEPKPQVEPVPDVEPVPEVEPG